MAIITRDMIISRETGQLLTIPIKFIRLFQPEIGKTKLDQVTFELI